MMRSLFCLACVALVRLVTVSELRAPPKLPPFFEVTATAAKPDATGQQQITIVVTIKKNAYVYANPVGPKDFEHVASQVHLQAAGRPVIAKVSYPRGETISDRVIGDYNIYRDQVTIQALVQRNKKEMGPLEVVVGCHGITSHI